MVWNGGSCVFSSTLLSQRTWDSGQTKAHNRKEMGIGHVRFRHPGYRWLCFCSCFLTRSFVYSLVTQHKEKMCQAKFIRFKIYIAIHFSFILIFFFNIIMLRCEFFFSRPAILCPFGVFFLSSAMNSNVTK